MHKSQSLFYLTTALHVSGVTITHLQEHKTTVTTASGTPYCCLVLSWKSSLPQLLLENDYIDNGGGEKCIGHLRGGRERPRGRYRLDEG